MTKVVLWMLLQNDGEGIIPSGMTVLEMLVHDVWGAGERPVKGLQSPEGL